jgi:hypothetical protein
MERSGLRGHSISIWFSVMHCAPRRELTGAVDMRVNLTDAPYFWYQRLCCSDLVESQFR